MLSGYLRGKIHPEDAAISVSLLFVGPTVNHVSRMLSKYDIKTVSLLPKKDGAFLWPVKNHLVSPD
jgi:hypothetical protein